MENKIKLEIVSANLRSYRAKYGMTQEELATKIGVHPQTIRNYEHNSSSMSLENLIKLAKCFKINPQRFFVE